MSCDEAESTASSPLPSDHHFLDGLRNLVDTRQLQQKRRHTQDIRDSSIDDWRDYQSPARDEDGRDLSSQSPADQGARTCCSFYGAFAESGIGKRSNRY